MTEETSTCTEETSTSNEVQVSLMAQFTSTARSMAEFAEKLTKEILNL